MKQYNIVVAGTGYVGLVTGVCLAEKGHNVTCVDVNQEKIDYMKNGKSPIYENGLEELMVKNKARLTYTTDAFNAYKNADVIFIGVGTPEKKDGSANLKYVYEVAKEIANSIEKDCIVVLKSTVPIGTNKKIEKYINSNVKNNVKVELVSNPEFLSQGTAVHDTLHAQRIVIGVKSKNAEKIMREVYEPFEIEYVITDRESAEMIKYASNDFLALKISYINEIANLCEIVGANITDVAKGMGLDSRIGNKFLNAGIGYGGSCFPKDTKALNWLGNYYDYELKTIKAAIEVNENQKIKLIKKARKYYETFEGLNVAVLGLAFKPNTDDLRDAPSLDCMPILIDDGAKIKAYDPVAENNYKKIYPTEIKYCNSVEETLKDADICFIFTEWDFVKNIDISLFEKLMKKPIILDGRNCFDINEIKNKKVIYESIGRKCINNY